MAASSINYGGFTAIVPISLFIYILVGLVFALSFFSLHFIHSRPVLETGEFCFHFFVFLSFRSFLYRTGRLYSQLRDRVDEPTGIVDEWKIE